MIYAGGTHRGCIRQHNEDSYCVKTDEHKLDFALVADGMGGHNAGEVAADMVARTVSEFVRDRKKQPVITMMREAIGEANLRVFERASKEEGFTGMGTTVVLAVADEDNLCIANVGDSRAYYYDAKRKKLTQVTRDHSLVEELVAAGRLKREEVDAYPYRNVITRAVGTSVQVSPDIFMQEWKAGDMLLLCTDGLTIHIDEAQIRNVMKKGSPQDIVDELIRQTVAQGARDNVTVVVMQNAEVEKK